MLNDYLSPEQVSTIKRAYFYAEQAHYGQARRTGEPYVTHPLAVATVLARMHMDHESIMAALLHDVIEDTGVSKEDIRTQFGEEVADLVDGVSKLTHVEFDSAEEKQAENFQKMRWPWRVIFASSSLNWPIGCTTCERWGRLSPKRRNASPMKHSIFMHP